MRLELMRKEKKHIMNHPVHFWRIIEMNVSKVFFGVFLGLVFSFMFSSGLAAEPAGSGSEVLAGSGSGSGQPVLDRKDPVMVANGIITAIRSDDLDTLVTFFNETNRKKFGVPLSPEQRKKMEKYLVKSKRQIGDVQKVEEAREKSPDPKPEVVVKIRVDGGEVFVVVLSREGEEYFFEDINSPSTESYEKLKPFVKK